MADIVVARYYYQLEQSESTEPISDNRHDDRVISLCRVNPILISDRVVMADMVID